MASPARKDLMAAAEIVVCAGLTPAERALVVGLQAVCEAANGLDLKLELTVDHAGDAGDTVLAYCDGELVGYCGIDYGDDAEICGMVYPKLRRRGIGGRMLDEALSTTRGAGLQSVLLICEEAFPAAMEWMRRRGATLDQSELRMILDLPGVEENSGGTVQLRPATGADIPDLVRLLSGTFNESRASAEKRLARAESSPATETLLAYEGETLIGTTRLETGTRRTMIYGFVIDRAHRGRGHGGPMMRAVLALLRERGVTQAGLEVEPENEPAVRLYTRMGFRAVTTYRYMRLPV